MGCSEQAALVMPVWRKNGDLEQGGCEKLHRLKLEGGSPNEVNAYAFVCARAVTYILLQP